LARSAWLARELRRRLGLAPRADSFMQQQCVETLASMEAHVEHTLHTAVWMHWLHDHT
jgi:hypothetical protein